MDWQSSRKYIVTQEISKLIPSIDNSEKTPKAIQQKLFWIAVGIYSLLLIIGLVKPIIGIIGLLLLGLVSLFKVIIRNIVIISILLLLGIAAVAIPFLLVVYIPVLLYFFIKRLGYLFQHFGLVVAGLFIYFFPIGIMVQMLGDFYSPAGLVVPIILFPIILKGFVDHRGYTIQKALEIMSEAPILIISIVLPFLKLNIGADFTEGVGSGETVAGEAAAAAKPVPNDVAFMKESPIYKGAFSTEVSVSDPVATSTMLTANSAITVSGFFQQLQDSQQIQYEDGTNSAISSSLNKIEIGDSGFDSLYIQNDGSSLKIADSQGDTIGFIKQNGESLKITDADNFNVGSITVDQSGFIITDSLGRSVASIWEDPTSLKAFTAESVTAIDSKLANMNDTSVSAIEEVSSKLPSDTGAIVAEEKLVADIQYSEPEKEVIDPQQSLAVILLSLIAGKNSVSHKSAKKVNLSKNVIKDKIPRENSYVYHEDSFYAYIQKYASEDFKNNERVYLYDEIRDSDNFSSESISIIRDKFKLSSEKILLILDDAIILKGTNGMILTEDYIYVRARFFASQRFLIDEVASLNKQGFFSNEAKFDNGELSYRLQEDLLKAPYKELMMLFKDYKNSLKLES